MLLQPNSRIHTVLPWRYYPAKTIINELCSYYWCRRMDCVIKSRNGHHGDVAYKQNFLLLQPLWSLSKSFSAHCGLFFVSYRYISKLCKKDGSPNLLEKLNWALTEENLLFLETWRKIDLAYVDKTFNGQNTEIKKMISTLNNDPFTQFLKPDKMKSLQQSGTQGVVTGVGLSIGNPMKLDASPAGLVVISTSPGVPSNRAGTSSGDLIMAIDEAKSCVFLQFLDLPNVDLREINSVGDKLIMELIGSGQFRQNYGSVWTSPTDNMKGFIPQSRGILYPNLIILI
ncbi:hypothetical protein UlMin_032311 [Ulmus minor]